MAERLCGAKTRAGTPCKRIAGKNDRCKLHGGRSTGAKNPHKPFNNQNAMSHGIFSSGWTEEERACLPEFEKTVGDLDNEILVAKVQLERVGKKIRQLIEGEGEELETAEVRTEKSGRSCSESRIRRRPDYLGIQDRLLGRIGRLTEQKMRILEVKELQMELEQLLEKMKGAERVGVNGRFLGDVTLPRSIHGVAFFGWRFSKRRSSTPRAGRISLYFIVGGLCEGGELAQVR